MAILIDKDAVKKMRLHQSWSQEKLAETAGVNLRTIQRIEKDGVASLQTCTAIAGAFDVQPIALLIDDNGETHGTKASESSLRAVPALVVNAIVFILWGVAQTVVSFLNLSSKEAGVVSFCFLFFAGIVLLTFLTPIVRWRPFVIAGCIVLSMLLSPPNFLAQIPLAVVLWVLFEISVMLTKRLHRA